MENGNDMSLRPLPGMLVTLHDMPTSAVAEEQPQRR
jgi:hypothetical protein